MSNALDGLKPNDLAIIERFERPWRLTNIEARQDGTIYVTGGFAYSSETGERLDAKQSYTKNERLRPITREGVDYLLLLAFQRELPQAELRAVPRAKRRRLAELVEEIAAITELDLGAPARIDVPE